MLAQEMSQVPGTYIAAALIPALIIAVLFYFDHTVSAQMAQLEEFNLRKPPAYHYDLLLLGFMTLLCGLIGLPPVNGVLPQVRCLCVLEEEKDPFAYCYSREARLKQAQVAGITLS